jgi:Tfp pilus assembly protein PilN
MITLNLLPFEEKQEIKLNRMNRMIFFYGSIILTVMVVFVVLLFGIEVFLSVQLREIDRMMASNESNPAFAIVKTIQEKISAANQNLQAIDQIQSQQRQYSVILSDLAKSVPAGVKFSSFSFDSVTKKAVLEGHSATRDEFLDFQKALEGYSMFSQIDSPVSNLTKSIDNDFMVSFFINNK